jgi:hypothetical protein
VEFERDGVNSVADSPPFVMRAGGGGGLAKAPM